MRDVLERRREIGSKFRSIGRICNSRVRDVQFEVGQLREPQQRRGVVTDEVLLVTSIVLRERDESLHERWRGLARRLLVETRAPNTVREANHRDGTIAQMWQHVLRNLQAVSDKVAFAQRCPAIPGWPHDFVEAGQPHLMAVEPDGATICLVVDGRQRGVDVAGARASAFGRVWRMHDQLRMRIAWRLVVAHLLESSEAHTCDTTR